MKKHHNGKLFDPEDGIISDRKKAKPANDVCALGHSMGEMEILHGYCRTCWRADENNLLIAANPETWPRGTKRYTWKVSRDSPITYKVSERLENGSWWWYYDEADNMRFLNTQKMYAYLKGLEKQKAKTAANEKTFAERKGSAASRLYPPAVRKQLAELKDVQIKEK